MLLYPLHNGRFDNNGSAFLRYLQDQMVPLTDFEGSAVEKPASSEGEFDERPVTLCAFFGLERIDVVFERNQCA